MTIFYIVWIFLQGKYKLPNELIFNIIYNFKAIEHPLSIQLKEHTIVKYYEYLQKSTFGKQIQKLYRLNKLEPNTLKFTEDYGYFIPRNYNMLYYNRNDENDKIQRGMSIKLWNLNRSVMFLYKRECTICGTKYSVKVPLQIKECYRQQINKYKRYTCDLCSDWIGTPLT